MQARTPIVALGRCESPQLVGDTLPRILEAADMWQGITLAGARVLVKPNLLRNVPLACTSPEVVASLCRFLLDCGARVRCADSPGFGTARGVARDVGLAKALAPLGVQVEPLGEGVPVRLAHGSTIQLSRTALEADLVVSAARVKAHSQMRLTGCCKNLYGCVPGLYKALYHTREGDDPGRFARMQADILAALPPVSAVADGVIAMHKTGPARGAPFALGLLGASASPVALDEAIVHVLGASPGDIPLLRTHIEAGHPDCEESGAQFVYPLLRPEDFCARGFELPGHLLHTSFKPLRLLKSCLVRLWKERFD